MSDDGKVVTLRPSRPPIDERTGIPVEVQRQLDGEILDVIDQFREMVETGKINGLILIGMHDEQPFETEATTARIWGVPSRAIGLLELAKARIAMTVTAAVDAAEFDDDED